MPRSSDSVAALAAALAKAQAELVNPEKSLIATIPCGRAGEGTRSFRYAPLSSGLDIVRKTLGQTCRSSDNRVLGLLTSGATEMAAANSVGKNFAGTPSP
jgi:hypothetical protein